MIAIKGMEEIPKNCAECSLVTDDMFGDATCVLLCDEWEDNEKHRAENCPLVEIVTCKDCIKGQRERSNSKKYCMWTGRITEDDFYCKDGKRREQK